jgi:hypothetical protein
MGSFTTSPPKEPLSGVTKVVFHNSTLLEH